MRRRDMLVLPALLVPFGARASAHYPPVTPGEALRFPRDHGAHPDYRTEWWYVTGVLRGGGLEQGFQITFFRSRPGLAEDNPSRFAPVQLLFAHAAIADTRRGRLIQDQRSAREGFGLARASREDTDLRIDDWSLARGASSYRAVIAAREFGLTLEFVPEQPLLAQGAGGFSRKGPRIAQASFYYSWPQLRVRGTVEQGGSRREASGVAWLDHEWSSEALAPEAVGWDWTGLNGDDGSALMAFRIRDRAAGTYWAGGSRRSADGRITVFKPGEVAFEPLGRWRSPHTSTAYPVPMRVRVPGRVVDLEPLMPDQEVDARASTGTVYWEGAVHANEAGRSYGVGYLELTGYWKPLKL